MNRLIFVLCMLMIFSTSGCGKKKETSEKAAMPAKKAAEEAPKPSTAPIRETRTFYDFEKDLSGWEIPLWAEGKSEYVAKSVATSQEFSSSGTSSMKIMADFPAGLWTAALVEIQQYLDLSQYRAIMADVYLPKEAPEGLKAKLIITVGESWKFVEMTQVIPLVPGQWVTITANIETGSYDWKRIVPGEEFSEDVRKIAVRVECNHKPSYSGPIYIDNVRAGR